MIRIEYKENEFNFEDAETASEFLLKKRKDGNEFSVTWIDDLGEVTVNETWLYLSPMFEDQDNGEFKCSPHGAEEDFDTDCSFIESSAEEVVENLERL